MLNSENKQGINQNVGTDDSAQDSGNTSSSPLPPISLPKGGGAIRSIGEKFAANPVTGTGSMTVPIFTSPGRSGFGPQLSLSYDSGAGNGPFGFGWNMSVPSITRKTDKGLPRYCDGDESDVFILSGAEDLVPILDTSGQRPHTTRPVHGITYAVSSYRPRIEGLFARIERWTATDTGVSHWRSISRDNVTTLYGFDTGSSIADPSDPRKIFSYHICRTWDDKGNVAVYDYVPENDVGIDRSQAHEANRTTGVRSRRQYLKMIRYGNVQPYFPDWTSDGAETPLPSEWFFKVVLDYGDHSLRTPTPVPDQLWPVRPDPFSTYRAGFDVRTYRRVERILAFHNFSAEESAGADCLVRSTDFVYSDQQAPSDPHNPIYTLLKAVTQTGYKRNGNSYTSRSLPPLEFEYSQPQIQPDVLNLDAESLTNLPEGLDGSRFQWVDLDGEGLSGILTDTGGAWSYKRNLSPVNRVTLSDGSFTTRARLGPIETVATLPSRSALDGTQQFLNLSGGGRLDVVTFNDSVPGFFKRTFDENWEPFQQFAALPNIDWTDANLKFVDLTGNGLADVLITEDGLFTLHQSLGEAGFGPAELVRTPWDEERGPKVVLADGTQTIFLADMSGDGLSDIVRVRNGETCYWPNLGYGYFGTKVTMDSAPRFTDEERFDPRRVRLADIDGSGTTDLLYIGEDGVQVCFNQSGNAWATPVRIAVFPTADSLSNIQVIDLLGTGTACLVWSSPLPNESVAPLRYVDLMGGQKPYLMVLTRNNLGAETRVTYTPSTRFYLADKLAGQPWITRLPHLVYVIERVEIYDYISRNRFVTRYAYHHGFYDGFEREFRGFGMVEQWDTEELAVLTASGVLPPPSNEDDASYVPPVYTRTWFHTGFFFGRQHITRSFEQEYYEEPGQQEAILLDDTILPDTLRLADGTSQPFTLSAYEAQEACRALKGSLLRQEIYALDGTEGQERPYSVSEHNYTIELLQPQRGNRHAVFFVHARETIDLHYERALFEISGQKLADPRVNHTLTLAVDDFGNILRSVSVGYPRRTGYPAPEPQLSTLMQSMLAYDQTRLHIVAIEHQYTNSLTDPVKQPDTYRLPLPSASITAEVTGVLPAANLFGFHELDTIWNVVWDDTYDIPYESVPTSDIDGAGTLPNTPTRRIVDQTRTLYRSDDLTTLLPQGQLQAHALPGQSYRDALTPGLLSSIFGTLVPSTTLVEGGYVQVSGETGWWIPSGLLFYSAGDHDTATQELAVARSHFYLPRRTVDPFGAITRVDYDSYDLLATTATDPIGNMTTATYDYRVLQPFLVTDPNGNQTAIAFDTLALVVGTAVMGKTTETLGDSLTGFVSDLDDTTALTHLSDPLTDPGAILGKATTRMVYDIAAYYRSRGTSQPDPPVVYTLARETHVSDLTTQQTTLYQHSFSYSDGFAREIQRKIQAEAGPVVDGGPVISPRWVGSGWTIFNNKGKPIRKYEPFFSATNAFEFAAQVGVSTILFYDPLGRVVSTLHPNNTWEKVVFDCWRQESWDGNDTVLIADPRTDPDVGDHFLRLFGSAPGAFVSWYSLRISGTYGATAEDRTAEQDAAQKTAAHAATPTVAHFDALGRTCLTVSDNGTGNRYPTRTVLDVEGKPLAVFDALGRRVMEYCLRVPQGSGSQYVAGIDLVGNPLCQNGMDGGARRSLVNVAGKPIRTWDARGHAFRILYDLMQRPTHRYVSTNGAAEILLERLVYGEGLASANLCGRLFRQYDTGGVAISNRYDFKGNLVSSTRQLAVEYRQSIDWSVLANLADATALHTAAAPQLLPADSFSSTTVYDALNRPIQIVTPYSTSMQPNVLRPSYSEANLLDRVDVWLQQAVAPNGLLNPTTANLHAVTAISYNARGQRTQLVLGNGTTTTYAYDPATFRMTHLTTTRPSSFAANEQVVQDLSYYYDPVGNITRIRDTADTQSVIYFRNQRVEPSTDYTYDPIYRLISATGREHLGQTNGTLNAPQQVTNDDSFRTSLPQPGDGNAMGTYTETYTYDPVGNLLTMLHQTSSGLWTRHYAYTEPSQITPTETSNRLSATSLPGDPTSGPYSALYTYDAHGNMVQMPHLPSLTWDKQDQLRSTTRQVVSAGTPETTFYVYDAGGQRLRKVTDRQAQPNQTATRRTERLYLGAVEIYREFAGDGMAVTLQRETLHISAGPNPVALIETRTIGTDPSPAQLIRYQYTNHLGSAALELDDHTDIISYEEYFSYGSTSYQAVRSQTETPKRYRYTGKEHDEENDFYYHGARYYAPWLGKWTSCDPLVSSGAQHSSTLFHSPYLGMGNNPIMRRDLNGQQDTGLTRFYDRKIAEPGGAMELSKTMHGLVQIGIEGWKRFREATTRALESKDFETNYQAAKNSELPQVQPNPWLDETNRLVQLTPTVSTDLWLILVSRMKTEVGSTSELSSIGEDVSSVNRESNTSMGDAQAARSAANAARAYAHTAWTRGDERAWQLEVKATELENRATQLENEATQAEQGQFTGKFKSFRAKDFQVPTELQVKVSGLHSLLDRIAQSRKTTAIGIVETPQGLKLVVASSDKAVPKAIRDFAAKEDILIAEGEGHAEVTILEYAESQKWILKAIAPSRDFCFACWMKALESGADIHGNLSPRKIK